MSPERSLRTLSLLLVFFGLAAPLGSPAAAASEEAGWTRHDLEISLHPDEHLIDGVDVITLRETKSRLEIVIHGGLALDCTTEGVTLIPANRKPPADHLVVYDLKSSTEAALPKKIAFTFKGPIDHPLKSRGEEYARSFSETPGIIGSEGVFLTTGSGWFPSLGEDLVTFTLSVRLPVGLDVVSQGVRTNSGTVGDTRHVTWRCVHPQDCVYLVAGPFTEYSRALGEVTAQAFLRTPDAPLAAKFLETTAQYVEMYNQLIGPYPYKKFALVENFWETGYGMPSFTLLGPKVIRFPFILHSSYPHEILHNWWGNGVFVDAEKGNWCEGLTAYLADHLIKEQQGQGAAYRRSTLEKYASYVRDEKDFPLTEFRSRHSASTEAVGYGKCLMLCHMLRLRLGDDLFRKGIRAFYRKHLFEHASFDDLEAVFSSVSGQDLGPFFSQWVERSGAPCLELADVAARRLADDPNPYRLMLLIRQTQDEEPYDIDIPVAIFVEGEESARMHLIQTAHKISQAEIALSGRPERIELDPRYDLFRRLDVRELPPSLGRLFGAPKSVIILPSRASESMASAWRGLAERWSKGSESVEIVVDREIGKLPVDASVWIFGRENIFCPADASDLKKRGARIGGDSVQLGKNEYPLADHAFAMAIRHPASDEHVLCWLGAGLPESLPGLGRKLPHYGKYSYLAFEGTEPTNVAKGQWPALDNPMAMILAGDGAPDGTIPSSPPLADKPPIIDPADFKSHIEFLASDELKGRGAGTPELDRAAEYVAGVFAECGLSPAGDENSFFQTWKDTYGPDGAENTLKNVLASIEGTKPELPCLVVGAHYDHLGLGWPDVREGHEGEIHNGADDNASGVGLMLEVARLLKKGAQPARTIVFAAFTGEEDGLRGSRHFVESIGADPAQKVFAMINIDSVGRLEGRKIKVLGTGSAKEWIHIVMGVGFTTGIQAEAIAKDSGGGDQVSFLIAGIPAVHVFSGLHTDYHRPTDDVDKLDLDGLVKAAVLVREMAAYLGDRPDPLTSTLGEKNIYRLPGGAETEAGERSKKGERRASLGTMPDFAYKGNGVRIAAVMPESPAQSAGLEKGDVITAIDDEKVNDLAGFAALLKSFEPGDTVTVHFAREDKAHAIDVVLGAR